MTASRVEDLDSESRQRARTPGILMELAEMTIPPKDLLKRPCPSGPGWPGCGSLTIDTITREVRSGAATSRPLPMEWGRLARGRQPERRVASSSDSGTARTATDGRGSILSGGVFSLELPAFLPAFRIL